ncbi:putative replicase-associated protein [Patrinia mild mottle virus]|uniref:Putative replicase-associated protein n=1 Tax=Patrinia mild mottle virus TaxID=2518104 RepID=A0A411I646_9TOMB|nr:putative replicase-associated protein [Patrinia mild mottle virus]QBB78569.1 putative replicase-associated protein [Patrinia mild mottle virus]
MKNLLKFLRMDYRPDAGLKTRSEMERFADPDWALLMCQGRMTTAHADNIQRWYEGELSTDVFIPEVAPKNGEGQGSSPLPAVEMPSPQPSDNDQEGDDLAPWLEERFELLKLEAEIAAPSVEAEGQEETVVFGPEYPEEYRVNLCRALVPFVPPPPERVDAPAHVQVEEGRCSTIAASFRACGGAVLASAYAALATAMGSATEACKTIASAAAVASKEVPLDITVEGPAVPMQEPGAPMGYVTSASIAMELRRRFGMPVRTPANSELGGRVAREILADRCGSTRSDAWYMSQEAVDFWLRPTVVDLVQRTRPVGFC